MSILQARKLSLKDVHRLFSYQRQYSSSFSPELTLEALTEFEQRELNQIRNDFDYYLANSIVSEGQIKLLTIAPLLRLAGFYQYPIQITLEEGIDKISVEDEDTQITGRLDILAINTQKIADVFFWVLVIECKNSEVAPSAGLPQLLTYAFESLKHQKSVWCLTTNGTGYQFVHIQSGTSPTYQLMPFLYLMEPEPSTKLLQVLKAICKL